MMKNNLKELYQNGLNGKTPAISEDGLLAAVTKGLITVDDLVEILGEDNALSTVRSAKLKEISVACNATIVHGIDVTIGDRTDHFNLALEDQSNINNLFRVVELGGTEFPYQADDGTCTIYSASEIASIYIAAQTHITSQTAYHNALKAYINTLETTEDITAVTYGQDLPEPFSTELANKLSVAEKQMDAILSKLNQVSE
jgi:hypothetical protein